MRLSASDSALNCGSLERRSVQAKVRDGDRVPVRKPRPSGLVASTEMSRLAHQSMSSREPWRHNENSVNTAVTGKCCWTWATTSGWVVMSPSDRTLPAATSPAMASQESASGTSGSEVCSV